MPCMKARKTGLLRMSKLQLDILAILQAKPGATVAEVGKALNLPPRSHSRICDSVQLLVRKQLVRRKQRTRVVLIPLKGIGLWVNARPDGQPMRPIEPGGRVIRSQADKERLAADILNAAFPASMAAEAVQLVRDRTS